MVQEVYPKNAPPVITKETQPTNDYPFKIRLASSFYRPYPSLLLTGSTPIHPDGGTAILPDGGGAPPAFLMGVAPLRTGWGYPPQQDWVGVSPLIRTGWRYPPGIVVTWTGYAAGGTPLAVSHRRTFLSNIVTARVRSTREGTVFTGVCLLTFLGGGYLPSGLGGYLPSQVWMDGGRYPPTFSGRGYLPS